MNLPIIQIILQIKNPINDILLMHYLINSETKLKKKEIFFWYSSFFLGQKGLFLIIKYYVSGDGHEPYNSIHWCLLIFSMKIVCQGELKEVGLRQESLKVQLDIHIKYLGLNSPKKELV